MDLELLERCNLWLEITGTIPHPYEVLALPESYLSNLAAFRAGVKFFGDASKRDPAMK